MFVIVSTVTEGAVVVFEAEGSLRAGMVHGVGTVIVVSADFVSASVALRYRLFQAQLEATLRGPRPGAAAPQEFGKNADMDAIPAHEVRDIRFDESVDVVVAGLGVAGSSAVVAASQAGAEVLAVERATTPGGTSANSGGLIYLGGGTALHSVLMSTATASTRIATARRIITTG
jgi:glutamate dehydrogenase/leucine dehydrogenase